MARATIKIDLSGLDEFHALVDRCQDYEDALRAAATHASATRRRLICLAFNPDDDTVLRCEEIEDRALGVIDKWARRDGGRA